MTETLKKDWRIGITWEVLILTIYVAFSTLEFFDQSISTNPIALLLLLGLAYYTYNLYKIQRFQIRGAQAKNYFRVGVVVLVILCFFALANMFLMFTGELGIDASYFNLIVIFALSKSLLKIKKMNKGNKSSS